MFRQLIKSLNTVSSVMSWRAQNLNLSVKFYLALSQGFLCQNTESGGEFKVSCLKLKVPGTERLSTAY